MSCLGIIYEFVSGSCNPIRMDIFQRVTRDTRDVFAGVEKMIQETFLPHLLFGKTETLSPIVGALSISVCWSGLHGPIAYSFLGGGVPIPEQRLCGTLDSVPLKFKVYYVLYPP